MPKAKSKATASSSAASSSATSRSGGKTKGTRVTKVVTTKVVKSKPARTPKKSKVEASTDLGAKTLSPAHAWPYGSAKSTQPEFRFLQDRKPANDIHLPGSKDTRVVCRTDVVSESDLLDATFIEQEISTKRVKFGKLPLMSHFLTHDKQNIVSLSVKVGKTSALQFDDTTNSFRKIALRKSLSTTPVNASVAIRSAELLQAGGVGFADIAN